MNRMIYCLLLIFINIFPLNAQQTHDPVTVVIFGGTGDLSSRKLYPALYNLSQQHLHDFDVIAVGRQDKSTDAFNQKIFESILNFSRIHPQEAVWLPFKSKLYYHRSDVQDEEGYRNLKNLLNEIDERNNLKRNYLFYFAIDPEFYPAIIRNLSSQGLLECSENHWSRVILEKPFGYDLESAVDLQKEVFQYLKEDQTYLIDHYLGKEGVQNILTFRFRNPLLNLMWDNQSIENVQITLAESIGVGSRTAFWEKTGLLRDVVQNHIMQILALIAMEPPQNLQDPQSVHAEKMKVLQALRPISLDDIDSQTIRGQYGSGVVENQKVISYLEEPGVPKDSTVETFFAAKLFIDNARWQNVPFYIRGGKRMAKQFTEIAITFKKQPEQEHENVLFIRIQPNPSIYLKIESKSPSIEFQTEPRLFGYPLSQNSQDIPEAYEKLIFDAIQGDKTLFVDIHEALESWKVFTPVLNHWKTSESTPFIYEAGSWGNDASILNPNHHWVILDDVLKIKDSL